MGRINNVCGYMVFEREGLAGLELFHEAIAAGAMLQGAILYGMDLSGMDLSGHNYTRTEFIECNLKGTKFNNCTLDKAQFAHCQMDGNTTFIGSSINYTNFVTSQMSECPIIDGGVRPQLGSYRFYATNFIGEGFKIKAGCRDFRRDHAYHHWFEKWKYGGESSYRLRGQQALFLVKHLEIMAFSRGWEIPPLSTSSQRFHDEFWKAHETLLPTPTASTELAFDVD